MHSDVNIGVARPFHFLAAGCLSRAIEGPLLVAHGYLGVQRSGTRRLSVSLLGALRRGGIRARRTYYISYVFSFFTVAVAVVDSKSGAVHLSQRPHCAQPIEPVYSWPFSACSASSAAYQKAQRPYSYTNWRFNQGNHTGIWRMGD